MPDVDSSITLAEFAATPKPPRRLPRWSDCLPREVVEQIMASNEDASQVAAWLRLVGYPDAAPQRVKALINDRDRQAMNV